MYKTNINIIGGIPDFNLIYDVLHRISLGSSDSDVRDAILDQDEYAIRTKKARTRFLNAIKSALLIFKSENHKTLFLNLYKQADLLVLKKNAIYLQLAINDELFFDLTKDVFIPLYLSGRLSVDKAEFTSYLYDLRDKKSAIHSWSDSTINYLSSKYLTLLKKLDLLSGTAKKEFKNIAFDDEAIIYFIYLFHSLENKEVILTENPYIPFLMLSQQNYIKRIKKIALDDFFTVTTLGIDLKIALKYSFEEIQGAIAQRHQSEV